MRKSRRRLTHAQVCFKAVAFRRVRLLTQSKLPLGVALLELHVFLTDGGVKSNLSRDTADV